MKKIILSQGKYALVDDGDFEELNQYKWYARESRKTFYATRNSNPRRYKLPQIQMHRVIIGEIPIDKQVDHRDGNGLNNQRNNLRLCTLSQNAMNKGNYKNNKSGFKGVCWSNRDKIWNATAKLPNKKQKNLGRFKNIEDAILARKNFIEINYGEFIRKN